MASLLRDGFDSYGAISEALGGVWTSLGSSTLSATTRFSSGRCLALPTVVAGVLGLAGVLGANAGTLFLNFSYSKAAAIGGSANQQSIRLLDSATAQCTITFNGSGDIRVYRGDASVLLGTYAGAFSGSGAWDNFQIKIIFGAGVAGSVEIRKNGNTVADFLLTGINNITTANAYANAVDIITESSSPGAHSIDDMWIFDNTVVAGEPSDWLGDIRAIQVVPNSDSAIGLTRSTGATNFGTVDELINTSADYVSGGAVALVDEYGNAGITPAPSSILGVTVRQTALKLDAGPRTLGARVRSGATVSDSAGRNLSAAMVSYPFNYNLNPNTGLAWTTAEIAAMLFGPKIVS